MENLIKKEYITNKDNLKGFEAAEGFLLQLESMGGGFWISTAKNLHCYYKDKYLFYLYDFCRLSIKIRDKYNSHIHNGTSDCSAHFFKLLKSKGYLGKLISITKSGYTLEIINSDNAGRLFEMICAAMREFALQNKDVDIKQKCKEMITISNQILIDFLRLNNRASNVRNTQLGYEIDKIIIDLGGKQRHDVHCGRDNEDANPYGFPKTSMSYDFHQENIESLFNKLLSDYSEQRS